MELIRVYKVYKKDDVLLADVWLITNTSKKNKISIPTGECDRTVEIKEFEKHLYEMDGLLVTDDTGINSVKIGASNKTLKGSDYSWYCSSGNVLSYMIEDGELLKRTKSFFPLVLLIIFFAFIGLGGYLIFSSGLIEAVMALV